MFVNRLSADLLPSIQPKVVARRTWREGLELSLCDEGMCFRSDRDYSVGTVLSLEFDPGEEAVPDFGATEGVVVECVEDEDEPEFYRVTVLFTAA